MNNNSESSKSSNDNLKEVLKSQPMYGAFLIMPVAMYPHSLLKVYFDSYYSIDELKELFDERLTKYLSQNNSKSSFDKDNIPF